MTEKNKLDELAKIGAAARLREVEAEMAEILRLFPDLRRKGATVSTATGRKRRKLSAAGRAAVSEGMRKYWARRKAAAAKAAGKASKGSKAAR